LARSEASAPKDLWAHRPSRREEAVSVPTKSDPAVAEEQASPESPNLWEPRSAQREQGSTAQELPEREEQEPHEPPEEQAAVLARAAPARVA
jgi:hypothetical protein